MHDFRKELRSNTYSTKEAAHNYLDRTENENKKGTGNKASNSDQKIRTRGNDHCR